MKFGFCRYLYEIVLVFGTLFNLTEVVAKNPIIDIVVSLPYLSYLILSSMFVTHARYKPDGSATRGTGKTGIIHKL